MIPQSSTMLRTLILLSGCWFSSLRNESLIACLVKFGIGGRSFPLSRRGGRFCLIYAFIIARRQGGCQEFFAHPAGGLRPLFEAASLSRRGGEFRNDYLKIPCFTPCAEPETGV